MGVSVSTYNSHERAGQPGARGFGEQDARRYGQKFGILWVWLVTGQGQRKTIVPVVGLIGAGGVIETGSEQIEEGGSLYEVEVPFPIPSDAIAFEVAGDSMFPRYDSGDVVICSKASSDLALLIGSEVAVGTPEGNRYLKRLLQGSRKGLYDLESHNAPVMRDVRLNWVSDVSAVVRANQVKQLNKPGQEKLLEQLKSRRR